MELERRLSKRVQAQDKVNISQEVTGGVHVQVLLQPPLGAGIVELSSSGEKEDEVVVWMGPDVFC